MCQSDLGSIRVLESQTKVVPLQQVQMATHHVQQGLALGKFLSHTHTHIHTTATYKKTQRESMGCGAGSGCLNIIYNNTNNV